jgi:hypothetical protein
MLTTDYDKVCRTFIVSGAHKVTPKVLCKMMGALAGTGQKGNAG